MLVFHSFYCNPCLKSLTSENSGFTFAPNLFKNTLKCGRSRCHYLRIKAAAFSTASSTGKDHYATLNIDRNATLPEIKSSYRSLARKYHPDINKSPGAEEKFKEISAAYEVLSDEEKRCVYDRFGEAGLQGEFEDYGVGSQGVDPFDVFDAFFGGSNGLFGGTSNSPGFGYNLHNQRTDILYDLNLSFEESVFGGKREIEITHVGTCEKCNGTGAKSSQSVKACTDCGGRGVFIKSQKTPFGLVSQVSTCSKCGGDGKIIAESCHKCRGKGTIQTKRIIEIIIPAGINDGETMQVQGEGNFDKRRGKLGDLYVSVHVNEKPGIWRKGLNLYSKINIDYTEAILGTVVKVETIEGLRDLHMPSGVQPGETIKLPFMGVPNIRKPSVRGDHNFIISIQIPRKISDEERSLVEKLASIRTSIRDNLPSKGIGKGKHDKCYNRSQERSTLGKAVKPITFLWRAVKNIFWQKEPPTGFAVVSMEAPVPMWACRSRADPMIVVSISLVFVLTCICSLTDRLTCFKLLERRRPIASPKSANRHL